MIQKSADNIVEWMINNDAIKEDDREIYVYGVYSFLLTLAPLILSIVFGIIAGKLLQSIVLIIPFMIFRKYTGGYHAKTPVTCFFMSSFLLIICIQVSASITCNIGLLLIMMMALGNICIWSPIDCENRKLDSSEKIEYKKITMILSVIFGVANTIFYFLNLSWIVQSISIGILLVSVLQVPFIIGRAVNKICSLKQ